MSNCIESGAGWTPSEAEASLMREQPLPPTYDQLVEALQALVVAVTFADPPKLFNDVLCHEARVPVEFVTGARALLARIQGGDSALGIEEAGE